VAARKNRFGGRVEVSEENGVRYLHLGNDAVQSAMRIGRPYALELAYTRAMMACLLLHPAPQRLCMIGLGGGSIAKFAHRYLPALQTHVIELNPRVIGAARAFFGLPANDDRLKVEVGDGAEFVCDKRDYTDLMLVDGFDRLAQVEALATRPFYDRAVTALRPGGILVVNLLHDDPGLDRYLQRIEYASLGGTLCLEAETEPNLIVFGFRDAPQPWRWDGLKRRADDLQRTTGMAFTELLSGLRLNNDATRTLLRARPPSADQ
jgi:spermidine synthase